MSIAGFFAENLTYARFSPSWLTRVFMLSTSTLNISSMAFLISFFAAFLSTTNISLFSASISLIDFSVDSGYFITLNGSIFDFIRIIFPCQALILRSLSIMSAFRVFLRVQAALYLGLRHQLCQLPEYLKPHCLACPILTRQSRGLFLSCISFL